MEQEQKHILTIIKIIVPAIIIITSIISFSKVVMYDEDIKKAVGVFLTKIFIGVMIFFIPSVVKGVLSVIDYKSQTFDFEECYNNATLEKIRQLSN